MATIRPVVLKNEQLSDGTYKVKISVFHKGKTCYISTDFRVSSPSHLKNGSVVKEPEATVTSSKIRALLNLYQSIIDSIDQPGLYTCSQIKDIILRNDNSKAPKTFKSASDEYVQHLENESRHSYSRLIAKAAEYFLDFTNGDVFLQDITPIIIESFSRHLSQRKKRNGQPLSRTMVSMILSRVKVVVNYSIREQYVSYQYHPFLKTKIARSKIREVDLPLKTMRKLIHYSSDRKPLQTARDIFVLSFLMSGMNLIDLLKIDFRLDEVSYMRSKTINRSTEVYHLPIPQEAKDIASKYLNKQGKLDLGYSFSYHNLLCYISRSLAKIKAELNIKDDLIFYSARKSFSQYATDLGVSDRIIDYCLAHSDSSRGVLHFYTRTRRTQAKQAIRQVIDYVFND